MRARAVKSFCWPRMYIGPWQEYKLAKLHKDAVKVIETLTAQLPNIHAGGSQAGGLTADNVASVLAHFSDAMAGGPPKPHSRAGTARTSASMPDISSHKRRSGKLDSYGARSASSTPGGTHPSRDGEGHSRVRLARIDTGRGRKKKKKKKKDGYVTKAMREVNRRRALYMGPSETADEASTTTDAAGAGAGTGSGGHDAAGSAAARRRVKLPPLASASSTEQNRQDKDSDSGGSGSGTESDGNDADDNDQKIEEDELKVTEQQALAAAGDVDKLPDMDDLEVDGMLDWVKNLEKDIGGDGGDDDLGFDFSDMGL